MMPLISVVMPVRNGARWVPVAVESVLRQELRDFEFLVVDDGSDDDSGCQLERFARLDGRVRIRRQAPEGIVAALNLGIREARAPYIARLDSDDVARPDRLARQLAYMEANGDIDLLGSAAAVVDEDGALIGRISPPTDSGRLADRLWFGNPFVHSSVIMRAAPVRRLGGYRATFAAAEDYDLWLRMAETGGIANLSEPLVAIRRHQSNVSRLNAVRQAFSVRLAQRAAAKRRAGVVDPAAALSLPPDWWAVEAADMFFAPDIAFYRFLDADRTAAPEHICAVQNRLLDLNHLERKLAQARLWTMLNETAPSLGVLRLRILLLIVLLHPARALNMALRARPSSAVRW
jgi:hypothetical protein